MLIKTLATETKSMLADKVSCSQSGVAYCCMLLPPALLAKQGATFLCLSCAKAVCKGSAVHISINARLSTSLRSMQSRRCQFSRNTTRLLVLSQAVNARNDASCFPRSTMNRMNKDKGFGSRDLCRHQSSISRRGKHLNIVSAFKNNILHYSLFVSVHTTRPIAILYDILC